MKILVVVTVTVAFLVGSFAWMPEPAQAQKPKAGAAAGAQKQVSGEVKSVDPAKKTVTLEDGTTLMVSDASKLKNIKPGAMIKASYSEKGGQKVASSIEVEK